MESGSDLEGGVDAVVWEAGISFKSHKTNVGCVGLKPEVPSLPIRLQCCCTYVVSIVRELKIRSLKNPVVFFKSFILGYCRVCCV